MSLLQAIYFAGAIALGVFMGVVIEYFLDLRIISELQAENHSLRLKLAENEKRTKQKRAASVQKVEHVETIEILDRTKGIKAPDFSQKW